MGQKIHPIGFRIGITKKHRSQWFARFHKHQYSQAILEDHILRETLLKLFGGNAPQLINTSLKRGVKTSENKQPTTKITQIKIERGLIPYEISIQIHAGDCELIKSSIDNLKINTRLTQQLLKSRRYLMDLKLKLQKLLKLKIVKDQKNKPISLIPNNNKFTRIEGQKAQKILRRSNVNNKVTLRRLKNRRGVKQNFRRLILNKLVFVKTGKILFRKIKPLTKKRRPLKAKIKGQILNRKFVDNFVTKANQKFLLLLKNQMKNWNNFLQKKKNSRNEQIIVSTSESSFQKVDNVFPQTYKSSVAPQSLDQSTEVAPLGYDRKWDLSRLNRLKKLPSSTLRELVKHLQSKALLRLEILREQFILLGSISNIESFQYYQMMTFLQNLKILVRKLGKDQLKVKNLLLKRFSKKSSFLSLPFPTSGKGNGKEKQSKRTLEKWVSSLEKRILSSKVSQLQKEDRKLKFLYYLKDLIKKHRTRHLFYYQATITDSKNSISNIHKFQKQNANFLLGSQNFQLLKERNEDRLKIGNLKKVLKTQIKNVYFSGGQKSEWNKGLQESLLEQIEKQKRMYRENINLNPKILIKFYKVEESNYLSKASLVADAIVDDLEKRKAFRKIIKQSKEKLMANQGVKGVKIQVAGRLNGAEMARTEWVKSGKVPLQTLRANIDYSYKTASTIYGIIGIKVWIYKGYTKSLPISRFLA